MDLYVIADSLLAGYLQARKRRQRSITPYTKKMQYISLMATFWHTPLIIVTLNIFLVGLFVVANKDSCGSVFETQLDHALVGHVMGTASVVDEFECQLKCIGNNTCKSFNTHLNGNSGKRLQCELNSKTRQTNPEDFKWRKGSSYFGSVQVSCVDVSRDQNGPIKRDCLDLLESGHTQSGEYFVDPDGRGKFKVYCDMHTDGGGWTVFQRRQDGSADFYRGWKDYKAGFGQVSGEFWLGNDKIYRLTASRPGSLRVELKDWNGVRVYAKYSKFIIGDEHAKYQLELGSFSGTAGDSLKYHNNMAFTTKDRDNDIYSSHNCAVSFNGAWWYKSCYYSNLNGQYLHGNQKNGQGVRWFHFRKNLSLKFAEMKIRPLL